MVMASAGNSLLSFAGNTAIRIRNLETRISMFTGKYFAEKQVRSVRKAKGIFFHVPSLPELSLCKFTVRGRVKQN